MIWRRVNNNTALDTRSFVEDEDSLSNLFGKDLLEDFDATIALVINWAIF